MPRFFLSEPGQGRTRATFWLSLEHKVLVGHHAAPSRTRHQAVFGSLQCEELQMGAAQQRQHCPAEPQDVDCTTRERVAHGSKPCAVLGSGA